MNTSKPQIAGNEEDWRDIQEGQLALSRCGTRYGSVSVEWTAIRGPDGTGWSRRAVAYTADGGFEDATGPLKDAVERSYERGKNRENMILEKAALQLAAARGPMSDEQIGAAGVKLVEKLAIIAGKGGGR